jgi:peptidoglycan/LPS O-acetylase OafA/YrhL
VRRKRSQLSLIGKIAKDRVKYDSLDDRLARFGGVGPGFDHLRIGLSLSILLWHSFSNSYGLRYAESLSAFPVPPLLSALLPMFFGLSGFLVTGSALRTNDVKTFLTFRTLRILPALFTEITLSAMILGPLLTSLTLRQYFSDPLFYEYFGSLIGRVRFNLPGLFLNNPTPNFVNFALWTVAPEILCYIAMTLLMVSGSYRNAKAVLLMTVAYAVICIFLDSLDPPMRVAEVLPSKSLILSFLVGTVVFLFRRQIVYSRAAALVSLVAATSLVFAAQRFSIPLLMYMSIPGYVYVVAVIGLTNIPKIPLLSSGDYSYGVYIYGFPIQQTIARFASEQNALTNFAIALPTTLVVAAISWHLVEKPFLALRHRFSAKSGAREVSHPAVWFVFLAIYALALSHWNEVFPIRDAAKLVLGHMGLYP